MGMTSWQSLADNRGTNVTRLAAFSRAVDVVANATLAPGAIFIVATSVWFLVRADRFRWCPELVAVVIASSVALLLILIRAISLLWPGVVYIPPRPAWIAFAGWVAVITLAIRAPLAEPTPEGTFY
jgi:hypothetical protein